VADAPSRPADRFFAKLGPALQVHYTYYQALYTY
jgi:hypothetical protein